mgnify:CR=1 FL=1
MRGRDSHFARDVNAKSLGFLGDPERWGSSERLLVPYSPPSGQAPSFVRSGQLCRGQVDSLAAVPWQVMVTAAFLEDPKTREATDFKYQLVLAIDAGVGQTMLRVLWDVSLSAAGAVERKGPDVLFANFEASTGDFQPGIACHLAQPIPAAAISVSAASWITAEYEEQPKPLPVLVSVAICPVAIPGWTL